MALESCEILIRTRGKYFHKVRGDTFTDGWNYGNIRDLIPNTSFRFAFEFLEDSNPTYLMPVNLLMFN